jgi:DNA-binding IclR family transcriptional regulator
MSDKPRGRSDHAGASESSRAVARVLEVLEHLSVAPQPLTNLALARRLGVPASSMFRLLQKLVDHGYVDFDESGANYAVSGRLGELGERLADAGCRSGPMRTLLTSLREATGYHAQVWIWSGLHVRLAAIMPGKGERGSASVPGELRLPFSTPGLAIAAQWTEAQIRSIARLCRRRDMALGGGFASVPDVLRALKTVRLNGYAAGYNKLSDGWAMIAWPVPIPVALDRNRIGAVAIGSRAPVLRSEERRVLQVAAPLLKAYRYALSAEGSLRFPK